MSVRSLNTQSPIETYIANGWHTLERTIGDLASAAEDPKLGHLSRFPVYLPEGEDLERIERAVRGSLGEEEFAKIELLRLAPEAVDDPTRLEKQGLLYLPYPYQVPGGRFNEMYGWDSYFINLGLLRSGQWERARWMVDNHVYQVEHYKKILNANRTYYLTRSQPPFLAAMVKDVFLAQPDLEWLERVFPSLLSTYEFWTSGVHLIEEIGLSRYYDLGHGPAPEVLKGEMDEHGLTHYDRIQAVFRDLADLSQAEQEERLGYPLELYYDSVGDRLTDLFFKGDRTMRESGYDPSDRFGRFNIDVVHYAPVDLNSLLYSFELDLAEFSRELGRPAEAENWASLAALRRERMQYYLWDPEHGLFFDYDFRTQKRRVYPFATSYFPLYCGWATFEQAAGMVRWLERFLQPGGVVTSLERSGNQWDYPFGWAPLQVVAAVGLQRYRFPEEARAISRAFVGLVEEEFERTGTILEKYDVVSKTSSVSGEIDFGYSSNEIGFGWTNGAYLVLREILRG